MDLNGSMILTCSNRSMVAGLDQVPKRRRPRLLNELDVVELSRLCRYDAYLSCLAR